jgi:hypothetical protein
MYAGKGGMTDTEYRTMFALWCLVKAPLMLGTDLTLLSRYYPVLPGPDVASQPTQQKSTAIWRKFAAISNFYNIPLLLVLSYRFAIKINA